MSQTPSPFAAVERERIKRERHNAPKYRKLYTDLLGRHEGVIQEAACACREDEESRLIQTMKDSELKAVAVGVACACATLATIRWGTPVLIRRIGGHEKLIKVQKADEEAKRLGTYKYQRAFAWTVEGGFSFWLGTRAYRYQSKQSEGAYETLSKIPLCGGRSVVADGLCDEWIDITTQQIPKSFWKNLRDPNLLNDDRAWRAIAGFSNNCVKRRAFQRKTNDDNNSDVVSISLPTRVPSDVELSDSEVSKLVGDIHLAR